MRTRFAVLPLIVLGLTLPAAAAEFEFPARKAGQWKIDMDTGMAQPMAMQICLDAATDKEMMAAGLSLSAGMCSKIDTSQDGGSIVIDATCAMGPMKTTSHTVISGDFQSNYTIETTSDIEGAPAGMPARSVIVQKATWVGECTDLSPGEMLMPTGQKVNIRQMMQTMGGGG